MMLVGGAVSLTVLASVNSVWKMSGHATGVGGLCAVVLFMLLAGVGVRDLTIEFLAAVLVAGVECTSRLVLERHTLLQVSNIIWRIFIKDKIIPYFAIEAIKDTLTIFDVSLIGQKRFDVRYCHRISLFYPYEKSVADKI